MKEMTRTKCAILDCKKKSSIIGGCKYCNSNYCNIHRLPETHVCVNKEELAEIMKARVNPVGKSVFHEKSSYGCY